MYYNIPVAKRLWLALWLTTVLQKSQQGTVETRKLFLRYLADTNDGSRLTETTFRKEIEPLMKAFHWPIIKMRTRSGRGYRNVTLKEPGLGIDSKELLEGDNRLLLIVLSQKDLLTKPREVTRVPTVAL